MCPQLPALFLELALILIPGHVGCNRRLECMAWMPPATEARTPPSGSDPALLELGTDSHPPIGVPFIYLPACLS